MGGLSIILVLCFASDIAVAVSVIKTASLFISSHPLIVFIPILSAFCILLYYIFWIIGSIFLYSIGTQTKNVNFPFSNF